jgi:hypothetical protein
VDKFFLFTDQHLRNRSSSTGGKKVAGIATVSIKETAEVLFEATALLIDRWHQKLSGNLFGQYPTCLLKKETGG